MGRFGKILFITLLISVLGYNYSIVSFIPEEELVFDQVTSGTEALVGENITIGILIKNYLDYSITNITVSLNLTEASQLELISCSLGGLIGDNLTINETMTSPIINEFVAVNITGLYMTENYLEYNISEIKPEEKMIFKYNITSDIVTDSQIPWAYMSFYDNWTDLQENIRSSKYLLSFGIEDDDIDPDLPRWDIGTPIPNGWAWIIFAVAPAVIAAVSAFVLYIRRR